ncbi:short-chain dehydrogenase [Pandoraea vervacti]|uniref:Short-chain dehydrogenase n=1 Tax=Pandoraea vervacti TaxID=656178 RepID=A0ABM5SY67_9BURK|nr:SDR family oxidoreductase [Pandoraea vervacti]AJP57592.1 short-chain dehydrogenase [Pandoraea vervacti]
MSYTLKPLAEQAIVITGATSGVGLITARKAARRGAKLVLVARNEVALEQLCEEIREQGGQAIAVKADVCDAEQMRNVAVKAIEAFSGFDTWVNNAGVSIFGAASDVPLDDQRKLFDTNYWGVVHGSLVAAEYLRGKQDGVGGAIINMGSEASDAPIPLQSAYAASKHAVKGFTDSLRLELEAVQAPVSVTLIKPAALDTMFVKHAKNYLDVEPKLPPPIYDPALAADAILHAASHPHRDLFVGAAAKLMSSSAYHMPGLFDRMASNLFSRTQRTDKPPRPRDENALHEPGRDLQEREGMDGVVFRSCPYTTMAKRPRLSGALAVGAAVLACTALTRMRKHAAH